MSQYKIEYKIEAGTGQHIGARAEQHDRVALMTSKIATGYVLAVLADGMSSQAAGHVAAEQVIHTSRQLFENYNPQRTPLHELLQNIITEAHTMIRLNGITSKTLPHSTIVLLVLTPEGNAIWAHVGDSRLYRFHQKQMIDHTNDAAYVDALMSFDNLPPETAKNHRRNPLLLNALGSQEREPFVTIGEQKQLHAGDAFLLCSDGLWHYFADEELAAVLATKAPRQASEMLIEKAGERAKGRGDNCSMAIIKLVKPPKADPGYKIGKLDRAV